MIVPGLPRGQAGLGHPAPLVPQRRHRHRREGHAPAVAGLRPISQDHGPARVDRRRPGHPPGAAVEVELSDIAPGTLKTVEWRGKPVWVMRRTPAMVAALSGHDAQLADPKSQRDGLPEALRNTGRSIKPELLVAVGICTHLGCSPGMVVAGSSNPSLPPDWPGGFFCPCHGSTFDMAGRVFKNKPAPDNHEVPPHMYLSDTKLLIGEDKAA